MNIFLYYDDNEAWDDTCDHVKKNEAMENPSATIWRRMPSQRNPTPCKRASLVDQVKKKK